MGGRRRTGLIDGLPARLTAGKHRRKETVRNCTPLILEIEITQSSPRDLVMRVGSGWREVF